MKLNPDCIRDNLLTVEENSDYLHSTEYKYGSQNFQRLNAYSEEEVAYHIMQCEKSDLIYGVSFYDCGSSADIRDLTPKGHEFLANIREPKIWNGIKMVSAKIGSASLDALTQIASNVVTELIKTQFGIPTSL